MINALKFADIKVRLLEALEQKLKIYPILGEDGGFSLVDGFMQIPVFTEIPSGFSLLGGPHVPTVGIIGNASGRIYTFALKVILPDIEI